MRIDTPALRSWLAGLAGVALAVAAVAAVPVPNPFAAAERGRVVPPPAVDAPVGAATSEVAVFAGGCFWGVQGVF